MTTLFAWTAPASIIGAVADHTWVTTYDSRISAPSNIGAVIAAGEDFWFCWGIFRSKGGTVGNPTGYIGSQAGDLRLARCLVLSNQDSVTHPPARGTIFRYGIDGVCHQLSNQILFATGLPGAQLTVHRARAYPASAAVYGTFGLQHTAWAFQLGKCAGALGISMPAGEFRMADEFMEHAISVLQNQRSKLDALVQLRVQLQTDLHELGRSAELPPVQILNERHDAFFRRAAELLGPTDFQRLFGFAPGEQPSLIDPAIYNEQAK